MRARRGGEIGKTGLAGLALCVSLATGGCADLARATSLAPGAVDPASAVAERVREAGRTDYPTPSFRDIPPVPTDVRPPEGWRTSVNDTVGAGAALGAWVAANPPYLTGDTEAFAEGQRASIPASEREGAPSDPAGTEAFAARLRALAEPPPPPN